MVSELPRVRDDGPNFQFCGHACRARFLGEPRGIIAQTFVRSDVNEQAWKTGEIGVERRGQLVPRIGAAKIVASARTDVLAIEHGAAPRICANRIASGGEVGPRREEGGRSRKRRARGTKYEQEGKCEPATGRIAGDNSALRRIAFSEQAPISGSGVINRGWKGILWREAIVRSENSESVQGEPDGDWTVCLGGATDVAAPVQIEKNAFCGIWRFDPFPGNPVHLGRGNPYGWRNFVRKGTKNLARDAIIAATFQAALDAPLNDPNREMRLKAGHGWFERITDLVERGPKFGGKRTGEGLGVPAGMG